MYRVMVQADPDLRKNMESLKNIKVKSVNDMAPISQFITMKKVYGPDIISRFNMSLLSGDGCSGGWLYQWSGVEGD